MSLDEKIRIAERTGDRERLLVLLARTGDQEALCVLGAHKPEVGRHTVKRLARQESDFPVHQVKYRARESCKACGILVPAQCVFSRRWTKVGDPSHFVGASDTFLVAGLNRWAAPNGILYGWILANGANWDVEFFRRPTRAFVDLVARVTNIEASPINPLAISQNGSGITVVFAMGTAPRDGATFEIHFDGDPDWSFEMDSYDRVYPDADVRSAP